MKIKSNKTIIRNKDKEWRDLIRQKDNFTCQICSKKLESKNAQAHHIIPRKIKELRWDVSNGICLCWYHHDIGVYSAHKNALYFAEWLKTNRNEQYEYLMNKLRELKSTGNTNTI